MARDSIVFCASAEKTNIRRPGYSLINYPYVADKIVKSSIVSVKSLDLKLDTIFHAAPKLKILSIPSHISIHNLNSKWIHKNDELELNDVITIKEYRTNESNYIIEYQAIGRGNDSGYNSIKKYPSNNEMEEKIKSTADYYYSTYEKNYGYTKETFLSQYGFSTEKDFLNNLRLDYRKNKYFDNYALSLVTDKEIEKYYEDEVFGDVDSKHILVSIAKEGEEGLKDEEAKKLANEIISKLDKGTSWDEVVKEYKDKIINEDLGYNAFNAELESAYLKECKNLKVGTYSQTPVLTSYGYHIVFKKAQKDKPSLKDVKDDVKEVLAKQKKDADTNLYYKSLIHMREDAGLKFNDTKLGEEYSKYMSQYK